MDPVIKLLTDGTAPYVTSSITVKVDCCSMHLSGSMEIGVPDVSAYMSGHISGYISRYMSSFDIYTDTIQVKVDCVTPSMVNVFSRDDENRLHLKTSLYIPCIPFTLGQNNVSGKLTLLAREASPYVEHTMAIVKGDCCTIRLSGDLVIGVPAGYGVSGAFSAPGYTWLEVVTDVAIVGSALRISKKRIRVLKTDTDSYSDIGLTVCS